jgi:hypothetical protein
VTDSDGYFRHYTDYLVKLKPNPPILDTVTKALAYFSVELITTVKKVYDTDPRTNIRQKKS